MSEIIKVEQNQLAKLDSFSTVEDMLGLAQTLIDSKLVPSTLKTPEAVVTVIQQGRELGFGAVTSVNNIHNIQGKPTLSIHAINAKLAQKGVKIKTIKDRSPLKNSDGKVVDYVTTIRFYVPLEVAIDGEMYLPEDVSFRWSEAVKMDLSTKSNWKKMPKIMMWSRCLSIGARRVAPDAILGMYEVSEMADVIGQNYSMTEDGEVTIIK